VAEESFCLRRPARLLFSRCPATEIFWGLIGRDPTVSKFNRARVTVLTSFGFFSLLNLSIWICFLNMRKMGGFLEVLEFQPVIFQTQADDL
jgi:hypothetical protein